MRWLAKVIYEFEIETDSDSWTDAWSKAKEWSIEGKHPKEFALGILDKSTPVGDTSPNVESEGNSDDEIRIPGKHPIKSGDRVRVGPSKPHARDGYEGTFRRTEKLEDGRTVAWIFGAKGARAPSERNIDLARITKLRQQTK